jgi:hypothetical protein
MSSQLKRPLGPQSLGKENNQLNPNNKKQETTETGSQANGKMRTSA